MPSRRMISPLLIPIVCFAAAIAIGGVLLHWDVSGREGDISMLDALFTSTSAVCVTGLVVKDTGTDFSLFGQWVILTLIQLGGLGIMTYSSLVLYLWRKRISITDRIAVGQSLLNDPSFNLGRFLLFVVGFSFTVEIVGALMLFAADPSGFPPFSALFHSISAFCNAGFALQSDSLMQWSGHVGVNLVFILLITGGGLGFAVHVELGRRLRHWYVQYRKHRPDMRPQSFSLHCRMVLTVSFWLVFLGFLFLYLAESVGLSRYHGHMGWLNVLFQSVTCRTAGFNTVEIANMTNLSLVFMLFLMIIGGSPGSTAGGVKTTTFGVMVSFVVSQIRGREQAVFGGRALIREVVAKALTLIVFAGMIVFMATLVLCVTEGGDQPHSEVRGQFLELLFEAVSAFATVGLSTGITGTLSMAGKIVIMVLMFLGRLGPILFLTVIQDIQVRPRYRWPEDSLMIG